MSEKTSKSRSSFLLPQGATSPPESYFDGRSALPSLRERIVAEVLTWPGVSAGPGRRGEYALRVGRVEIGHLHGASVAHFGFPKDVWDELIRSGRIVPHPLDQPGLAARRIRDEDDVRDVIDLMRLNYDRIVARRGLPSGGAS